MPAGRMRKRLGTAARRVVRRSQPVPAPPPGPLDRRLFVNPVGEGADPHVVRDGDRYLWCLSEGNIAVAIWVSDRLTAMGRRYVVWWAPPEGPYSKEVWAPELHRLDGRWYIYLAASDGRNRNHLTYVLVAHGDDPLGPYDVAGPLWTGAGSPDAGTENLWSIDLTVLEHCGRRYGIWSGWPEPDTDVQHLYAAELTSPTELAGPRVRLCPNDSHLWERTEEQAGSRGLHEAPQVVQRGGRVFVTYSCAASWLPTYKVGMLELTGNDPLDPASWVKHPEPVFVGTDRTPGVGHGCVVHDLGAGEWWHVYHAKRQRRPGWQRGLHVQPLQWTADGAPDFGVPVSSGEPIGVPAATPRHHVAEARSWSLETAEALGDFDYYGHHQYAGVGADGLHLGRVPALPVNEYRSGEKVVLRDGSYGGVTVTADFTVREGSRGVGALVRVTGCAVGYDAQRGYFAGICADRKVLMIGATDGRSWTELATAPYAADPGTPTRLVVDAVGDQITARADGVAGVAEVSVVDATYPTGSVGLRVVDSHAVFARLAVQPLS